jgi:branched-chain amino acid transport system ATP-binding protein
METHDATTVSVLDIQHLAKSFAGLKAVNDVSFSLRTGEILGLIGPNGSGKTTLINVVTGLLRADGGSVAVDGVETTRMRPHNVARTGIARTFQTIRLFKELTVLENVEVGAVSQGMSRSRAVSIAQDLLEEMGIAEWGSSLRASCPSATRENSRSRALSPCVRSSSFSTSPPRVLNEDESDLLLELLREIPARKHVGLLVVEHDMRLMMNLCARLHVLNYGKTIAEGTPAEVRANPDVVTAYLGSTA